MNVRYLKSLPQDIHVKRKYGNLQLQLTEFMKISSPVMEISINKHYKNVENARNTWVRAVKKSGYSMRVLASKDKEVIYIVKVKPDEDT